MGRAKEWMMEQERLEEEGATIELLCPNPKCSNWIIHYNEIPLPNLLAEKQRDITQTENIEIFCDNCNSTFNGSIINDSAFVSVELEGYPDLDINVDVPYKYYDSFEDYLPPDDPFFVAKEALSHLTSMIGLHNPVNDPQFTSRLVFVGGISVFEAYLGDTLINAVLKNNNPRNALIKKNKIFSEMKFSAAELVDDVDLVTKRIVKKLKETLYHNLAAVTALYKDAFALELMPSQNHRDFLFYAVVLRHDCVHRNGQDKDGNKLNDFTSDYVSSVLKNIEEVIDHIENRLNAD